MLNYQLIYAMTELTIGDIVSNILIAFMLFVVPFILIYRIKRHQKSKFILLLLIASILFWLFGSYQKYSHYLYIQSILKDNLYLKEEGKISRYSEHSHYRRELAHFYIKDYKFFSKDSHGFNNNYKSNVVWKDGLQVKVHFYRKDNGLHEVLKIWVVKEEKVN